MAQTRSADSVTNQTEMKRPLANFPKSLWEGRFKPLMVDDQVYEMQAKEIAVLKEEVGSMLNKQGTTLEKLNLIDTVERLGISYHFEKQISTALEQIFLQITANSDDVQDELHATALMFRLLRQHGFSVSSGIFDKFLSSNGHFKESLIEDKKGLLSLYEAAHLRTHKDSILDEEALVFCTTHLNHDAIMPSLLAKQVSRALVQPLHRGSPRLEARDFISVYEEVEGNNPVLLRFAKLDYRHLQILYRKELDQMFSWSEGLGTKADDVPYSRPRLVECYFWALTVLFEPKYSLSRISMAKTFHLGTMVDDTFDAYGVVEELKVFRDAFERWDVKEIDHLPEHMKSMYMDVINCCEWANEEVTKLGKSIPYGLSKLTEEWKQYVRKNYTQASWLLQRDLPAFDEYKKVALITTIYYLSTQACFLFMEDATNEVFEYWLAKEPKIVTAMAAVGRFLNDVASHETEKERSASGLQCYMNDYKVSEEEAKTKLEDIVEDAWKDMNEEFLEPNAMARDLLLSILNTARVTDVVYKHRRDGFTDPAQNMEPHIVAVLLDIIQV